MRSIPSGVMVLLSAVALSLGACATSETAMSEGGGASLATAPMERAASGTAGDSLQACLSRIPRDASAGQRMIAEESCKRDETNRKSIEAVPGR